MQSTAISRKSFIAGAAGLAAADAASLTAAQTARATEAAEPAWDHEVDFLVVGSGTAAFGALAATEAEGATVMIIEKHPTMFGGTSATSGAGFWIPGSPCQVEAGVEDSLEDAATYMKALAAGRAEDAPIDTFVANAAPWLAQAVEATGAEFHIGGAQDYYDGNPGFLAYARNSKLSGTAHDLWEKTREVLEERGVQILMGCALTRLVTDENGAVVGVEAEADGTPVRIKAGAVLLGTGGFDHDPQMMAESIDHPVYLTNAAECNTGDGHRAAARIGAKLALMDTYWGTPFFYPADPSTFDASAPTQFSATSCDWNGRRGYPNAIVVNAAGKRFGDESTAYAPFVRPYSSFSTGSMGMDNLLGYFICDADFMKSDKLPGMTDDSLEPNEWFVQADTLEELAGKLGIDAEGLVAEVERFNGFAETGVDEDFHRGEKESGIEIFAKKVDRPELANPVLGPIATPPFYGALYLDGTCGTSGGVKINEYAQAIDVNNQVIEGLYACGNCTASISGGGYMGGGATLAPGCVMGYIAARHALGIA